MNEVEKMYENCNIKPKQKGYCDWDSNCPYPHHKCDDECPYWKYEDEAKYPPFTAEKQIELIKWLIQKYKIMLIEYKLNLFYIHIRDIYTGKFHIELDETIAGLINNLWQDLTDAEKVQIKNILELEVRE